MARTLQDDGERSPIADAATTVALCALAVGVTAFGWLGKDVTPLHMSAHTFWQKPWQALTSVLPHGNVLHILFNVTMCFPLGRRIEAHYGSFRTLLFYVLLGAGSSAAEYAIFSGGIGLSGIVYGQWGFLWIASKRTMAFAGAVDNRTNVTFIVWFFFCIAATYTGALHIANVAHGAGALLGILTAYAVTTPPKTRPLAIAGLVAAVVIIGLGATKLRPWVNMGGLARDLEREALDVGEEDPERAVALLRKASAQSPKNAQIWYNRGVYEYRLGNSAVAVDAFNKACSLADDKEEREHFCRVVSAEPE